MHFFCYPRVGKKDNGANYLFTVLVTSCLAFPFAMTFCSKALENKEIQSTLTSLTSYEQMMSSILGDCWGNYKYGDNICKSHVREIIGHCCLQHAISVVIKEIAVNYQIITILNFGNSRLSKSVLKHKSYYLIF